ncbi:MAG: 3-isopropylmalate dehydratase/homoaconitate hydratase family large subunit [Caldiserica bacterium]|nr:3-isopropylmalate dehydratase/homoaconitate hydratase family large subunit [Caldisericota bacterium]
MGRTVIEKIFAAHTADEVAPGRVIWLDLDVRSARDFAGANVVKRFREAYPGERVADPERTFFTFDCNAPANTIAYAQNQQICRRFAREQGIRVYDVDSGIGSHVLMEEGIASPGATVVGTDSHLNILGAVGAFGQGMGDVDIAFAFRHGKTWFEVPHTVKIVLRGRYEYPTTAKDLTLFLVGKLGARGALGKAVEIEGEAVEALDMAGRITLCSMATEMGAISAFLPPSESLRAFVEEATGSRDFSYPIADPDAEYTRILEFDVSGLKPMIAAPPRPDNVHEVAELEGERVDTVFVGSCTNGRYEDIRAVAEILKGRRVAKGVVLKVAPATRRVWGRLLKEGWLEVLYDAGAIIAHAACAGCAQGQIGMTGEGEVQLSTGNRNFPGKQGRGPTYLCSPATAAASALFGVITSPERL